MVQTIAPKVPGFRTRLVQGSRGENPHCAATVMRVTSRQARLPVTFHFSSKELGAWDSNQTTPTHLEVVFKYKIALCIAACLVCQKRRGHAKNHATK